MCDDLDVPLANRKHRRESKIPARYLQESPPRRHPPKPQPTSSGSRPPKLQPPPLVVYHSERNAFGILKRYLLPEGVKPVHSLIALKHAPSVPLAANKTTYDPFPTKTAFLLSEWYWNSRNKSFHDFQKLISVFTDPTFSLNDAIETDWRGAFKLLGANRDEVPEGTASWMTDDGWKSDAITLEVPFHTQTKDPGTRRYVIGDFRHRSIVSVIKERLSCRHSTRSFHYHPYRANWQGRTDSPESELYGEMYTSRAFREAHEALQRQPPTSHNTGHERVVVALMFWSDGTQLTSFGGASLWPCYMFFGNDSKYERGKPSEQLGSQIAYFLKVSWRQILPCDHPDSSSLLASGHVL